MPTFYDLPVEAASEVMQGRVRPTVVGARQLKDGAAKKGTAVYGRAIGSRLRS